MHNQQLDSPPTSCESETFKTPKQTASARTTEKTPKASSPLFKSAIQGDIPALAKLEPLTSREKAMTVEEWLKSHVKRACDELEAEGNRRIAKLQGEMERGRSEAEKILRGLTV